MVLGVLHYANWLKLGNNEGPRHNLLKIAQNYTYERKYKDQA